MYTQGAISLLAMNYVCTVATQEAVPVCQLHVASTYTHCCMLWL